MSTRVIVLEKGYGNGNLDLSDRGHTPADAGDTILWQIKRGSGVESITSIKEKQNSADIFSTDPFPVGQNWKGIISETAAIGAVYQYSIHWKSDNNESRVYDPIISIKPTFTKKFHKKLILLFVTAFLGLLTQKFFRNSKKVAKRSNKL